ncbi:hypothetical protein D3C81_1495850 [compost metagenome]
MSRNLLAVHRIQKSSNQGLVQLHELSIHPLEWQGPQVSTLTHSTLELWQQAGQQMDICHGEPLQLPKLLDEGSEQPLIQREQRLHSLRPAAASFNSLSPQRSEEGLR